MSTERRRGFYVPVKLKFIAATAGAAVWFCFSAWISRPWIRDLAAETGMPLAIPS